MTAKPLTTEGRLVRVEKALMDLAVVVGAGNTFKLTKSLDPTARAAGEQLLRSLLEIKEELA